MVLFDEIEKAHPDIFNSLLQILEDGRLTDAQGRVVDFKNTVIIMTTNLGTRDISKGVSVGFGTAGQSKGSYDRMKSKVQDELKSHFRPEFLNRVDDIIVFHALTEGNLKKIVDIQVKRLQERLDERHITIRLTDEAKSHLVREGYDPSYGARPLKRALQKEVETVLSRMILKGDVKDGQTVEIDYDVSTDGLDFKVSSA